MCLHSGNTLRSSLRPQRIGQRAGANPSSPYSPRRGETRTVLPEGCLQLKAVPQPPAQALLGSTDAPGLLLCDFRLFATQEQNLLIFSPSLPGCPLGGTQVTLLRQTQALGLASVGPWTGFSSLKSLNFIEVIRPKVSRLKLVKLGVPEI